MPKIKTHSGAKKRFKLTKNGKVLRAHAYKSHILNKKTTKRKRNLRKTTVADVTNVVQIKRLIPYKYSFRNGGHREMARVKGALMTRKRRKKILKLAKGYYGAKSKLFRTAKEAVMKSGQYAYIGRRQKKRDFRRLWITRISAAAKINGMNYSTFMNGMKKAGITLNRKMLAELAVSDAAAFAGLAEKAKAALK